LAYPLDVGAVARLVEAVLFVPTYRQGGPNPATGFERETTHLHPPRLLVPTLRVGTHCPDALRRVGARPATRSVSSWRSHAERGNEVLGILAQNQSFFPVADLGVIDPGALHRSEVERRVRAEQDAVGADLAHRPLDQVRRDRPGTRSIGEQVAVLALLDRAHLVGEVTIPAAAKMGDDQLHFGMVIGER